MVKNQPAQPAESSGDPDAFARRGDAEHGAAAAMIEASIAALHETLAGVGLTAPPHMAHRIAAAVLQAGLRALADHQHRTPSALPAASPVARLRTVASEMARV